jgi:hypothetical protein
MIICWGAEPRPGRPHSQNLCLQWCQGTQHPAIPSDGWQLQRRRLPETDSCLGFLADVEQHRKTACEVSHLAQMRIASLSSTARAQSQLVTHQDSSAYTNTACMQHHALSLMHHDSNDVARSGRALCTCCTSGVTGQLANRLNTTHRKEMFKRFGDAQADSIGVFCSSA